MERKWQVVVRDKALREGNSFFVISISDDLYQRIGDLIGMGKRIEDDMTLSEVLMSEFKKHCKDNNIQLSKDAKIFLNNFIVDEYIDAIEYAIGEDFFHLGLFDDDESFIKALKKHDSRYNAERIADNKFLINGLVIEYDSDYLVTNLYYDFKNTKYNFAVDYFSIYDLIDGEDNKLRYKLFKSVAKKTFNDKKVYALTNNNEGKELDFLCFNNMDSLDISPWNYLSSIRCYPYVGLTTYYDYKVVTLILCLKEQFGIKQLEFFMSEEAKGYQTFDDNLPINSEIISYIKSNLPNVSHIEDPEFRAKVDYYNFLDNFSVFYKNNLNRMMFCDDYAGSFDCVPLCYLHDYLKNDLRKLDKIELEKNGYVNTDIFVDNSLDYSYEDYEKVFDDMFSNELNEQSIKRLFDKYIEPSYINFQTNDAFEINPLYEDIILEAYGLDKDMILFDYVNGDYDSLLKQRDNKQFRTSIILNHLHELIGFVCQCKIKDLPHDILELVVDKKLKLICDDLVLNTRNIDVGYDIMLNTVYGFQRYWQDYMCKTKEGKEPKILTIDDESISYNGDTITKCEGYKNCFHVEDLDGCDGLHYLMQLDSRIKKIAPEALENADSVLVFYKGNMLDAMHLLDNYPDLQDGVIVCEDGVISKVNIIHPNTNKEFEPYFSGTHMQNQTLLSGLDAIRKNQIFTFVTCTQMQFINYRGMNSFMPNKASLYSKDDDDLGQASILDIDVFKGVRDPDFEAG